jgi:hypothetical protein
MLPVLHDELGDYRARLAPGPGALVFATTSGRRHSQSNIRQRVLAPLGMVVAELQLGDVLCSANRCMSWFPPITRIEEHPTNPQRWKEQPGPDVWRLWFGDAYASPPPENEKQGSVMMMPRQIDLKKDASVTRLMRDDDVRVVPEDEYMLRVESVAVEDQGLIPFYRILEGSHAGQLIMLGRLLLTDAAKSISFRNLADMGLGMDFIKQADGLKDIATAVLGRTLRVEVLVRDSHGESRNSFPIGGVKLVEGSST